MVPWRVEEKHGAEFGSVFHGAELNSFFASQSISFRKVSNGLNIISTEST